MALGRSIIGRAGIAEIKKIIEPTLIKKFNEIKEDMLNKFDGHPVTRELEMGADAPNISRTIRGGGNLFSFIGFGSGDKPTDVIRNRLKRINIKVVFKSAERFDIIINSPERQELFALTPLPWARGRSWLKGIEHGLSGLGRFLYGEFPSSRSGAGIQTQGSVRRAVFRNTSYVSAILRDFKREVNSLQRGTLI